MKKHIEIDINNTELSTKMLKYQAKGVELKNFIAYRLEYILKDLNIPNFTWAIGGSAALLYYNIDLGRELSDIDVILPKGKIRAVADKIKESPLYKVIPDGPSLRDHYYMNHIKFTCAEGPAIDLVEVQGVPDLQILMYGETPLVPIEQIIYLKQKWGRYKDNQDLSIIMNHIEKLK